MKEYYRALFVCENDPEDKITVDLVIENRRWVEHIATAGWWGSLNTDNIWPFILRKTGRIDFGNDPTDPYSADVRFASLEISDCIIARGEKYSFRYHDRKDFVLERLTKISDLLE